MSSRILNNVLEMVGNTPMVRLDKIAKSEGLECELCEFIIEREGVEGGGGEVDKSEGLECEFMIIVVEGGGDGGGRRVDKIAKSAYFSA